MSDARSAAVLAGERELQREKRARRYANNLWALCTEPLALTKFSPTFHKPLLDENDRRKAIRRRGVRMRNDCHLWARYHYKTTFREAEVIQDLLHNPQQSIIWWHEIGEPNAVECVRHISAALQFNDEIRRLFPPGVLPSKINRRFFTSDGFTLNGFKGHGVQVRPMGVDAEATGLHADVGIVDDIVGLKTIENNLMARRKRWMGSTLWNVIGGEVRATGTHWDVDDVWWTLRRSPDWDVIVRGALEINGTPDEHGEPVLYDREWIEFRRRSMNKWEFSCQMLNIPIPEEDRIWPTGEERWIEKKEAETCQGVVVVISDPAPAKVERDETDAKDDWANCAIKLRCRDGVQEAILLDGDFSDGWLPDEGFDELVALSMKYPGSRQIVESYGSYRADNDFSLRRACQRNRASYRAIDFGGEGRRGKKPLWQRLCEWSQSGRFLISKGCREKFVDRFLDQCRQCRFLANGKNNLAHDDCLNVVSMFTLPEVLQVCPRPKYDPRFEDEDEQVEHSRSRYCGI